MNTIFNMDHPFPQVHHYYDGKLQKPQSAQSPVFTNTDPSTGQELATVSSAEPGDVDLAIQAAEKALPLWSAKLPLERSRILLRAVQILRDRNDEIARRETQDTGKPLSETSTVDVVTGADVLEYFANLVAAGGLNGEMIRLRDDAWVYTSKEPLGVCAGIGAWNYPIQM